MLKIEDFFDELKLRRDSHVADFGCGIGNNSKILSDLLPDGKVFAVDVHKEKLEYLEIEILKEKRKLEKNIETKNELIENIFYQNIVPVWGDIETLEGTRLRDESIDAILISNVFFLLQHKKTCIMEMKRVLKKYGKILFVDWHKHLGDSVLHKNTTLQESEIVQLFIDTGFDVRPRIFKDNYHFVLLIEKK
jgi:ubiquinone/menaquinone biosynthesis C-methylase UbiE